MSRALAVALAVLAGSFAGMQAPVNARLGRQAGSLQAATVSFLVGTLVLLLVASLSSRGLPSITTVGRVPWWALIGGVLGAVYVTVAVLTVRTLGVSGLTAIVVTGQLSMAVVIDRFGLLGVSKQHIDAPRVAGLVFLLVGVVLVVRR